MTDYAVDIASYQAGLNLTEVAAEGFGALFVKCTDGVGYVNPYYAGWMGQRSLFKAFIPYHYLEGGDSAASQVAFFRNNVGFATQWAMLDVEDGSGNAVQIQAAVAAFKAAGYKVLLYMPKWYWQEIGSPNMSGWGVDILISSGYPGGVSAASTLYTSAGGDSNPNWAAYGGLTPGIWQFTDSASVAGQKVDANALKAGILGQLSGSTSTAPVAPPAPVTTIIASPASHNLFTPLVVDGDYGPASIKAVQLVTYSGHVALCSGAWNVGDRESLQQHLGVTMDGAIGPVTVKALQKRVGATQDGLWGVNTTKALQNALNAGTF